MPQDAAMPRLQTASMDAKELIAAIHQIRKQPDSLRDWNRFSELLQRLCRARNVLIASSDTPLVVRGRAGEDPAWVPSSETLIGSGLMARAYSNAYAHGPCIDQKGNKFLCVAVRVNGADDTCLLLDIGEQDRHQLNDIILRALLAADFSAGTPEAAEYAPELLEMLDLSADVMQQKVFGAAALALVNGAAAKLDVPFAALSWVTGTKSEVVAISHLDRFDRGSRQVEVLSDAFADVLQTHHEVWWPPLADEPAVPALDALAIENGFGKIFGTPIRDAQGSAVALLILGFTHPSDIRPSYEHLLLCLELLQPRLTELHHNSLGWPKRLRIKTKGLITGLVGPGHEWSKALGLLVSVFLIFSIFCSWPYRLEATAQLTTDSTRIISAQFDGRVESVYVTAGDLVREGDALATLDTRDLREQESEFRNELKKAEAELGKARASNNQADAQISNAKLQQASARLARVTYSLDHAKNIAPFDGVVVEGERKELMGAPVKRGDRLFRVAKIKDIYATLMVHERDARDILIGTSGELSLLSRPDSRIAFKVMTMIPVAQVKGQEGNNFVINAKLLQEPEPWWRPGMTGAARIDVGNRNIFWILTHRIVDAVRMKFWL